MRIVHVTDCYLPRLGGIEMQVADLVRHQQAAGHDVHVVTCTKDKTDTSARVHRIRAGWVREILLGSARTMRAVSALRPDVVHCHNSVLSPLAVAVAGAASDLAVPTAVTVHSLLPAVGPILPLSGHLLGMRDTRIAWSAVSGVAAAPIRRFLGRRATVEVLPNAVDISWWRDVESQRDSPSAEVRFVTVGRLAVRKRPLALLTMMARVRELLDDDVTLRLTIVGDGPQRERVERRVRDLGMSDWVDLPGQLPRQAIRAVLADADVYVAPAVLESFGIAALEARSVGLPVVAKAHGGVGEFVHDGTEGYLLATDQDMVGGLLLLARSASLRRRIREHNSAVAPAFGWDEALDRTDRLYARAAHLAGRRIPAGSASPRSAVDLRATG
jgi:glycosyltransferase involved in cell wall biosynthesis